MVCVALIITDRIYIKYPVQRHTQPVCQAFQAANRQWLITAEICLSQLRQQWDVLPLVAGLCPELISVQDRLQSNGSAPSALMPTGNISALPPSHKSRIWSHWQVVINLSSLSDISVDDIKTYSGQNRDHTVYPYSILLHVYVWTKTPLRHKSGIMTRGSQMLHHLSGSNCYNTVCSCKSEV